ncbi:MAG TPA: methyltransferase domain-containing protein [Vicinamibacterales bacterium]|jgi:SAM-dependent methyltransferase
MAGDSVPAGLWINIGSGPGNADGWIGVDGSWQALFAGRPRLARIASRLVRRPVGAWPAGIVRSNLRRRLPFDDESAAVVYSSHTLEHLHRNEAVRALNEMRRVLKRGGVCRVVVPDVHAIVRWYLEKASSAEPEGASDQLMSMMLLRPRSAETRVGLLAQYRRLTDFDSHKWMYDQAGLVRLFRDAGFGRPEPRSWLDSAIDERRLAHVEQRDRVADGAGVCVEAVRD